MRTAHAQDASRSASLAHRCTAALHAEQQGFSVVELVIAALVLTITAAAGIQLFNDYLASTENARIRDSLSSLIIRDIEAMRYKASRLWSCSAAAYQNDVDCLIAANQGGLTSAYAPPRVNCENRTLASAAAIEDSTFAAGSSNLVIDATTTKALRNARIQRTIQHRDNIIAITYTATDPVSIRHIAYITANAQPWCTP
jgi:type II secretory pathway pseudopilin PulG